MSSAQRILVAVDGSAPSLRAIAFAAELARAHARGLLLVHVMPPLLLPPVPYERLLNEVRQAREEDVRKLLEEARSAAGAVPVETRAIEGDPARELVEQAEKEKAWLVVTGSTGRSAVTRLLIGSVADRLVHTCERPVLVVR